MPHLPAISCLGAFQTPASERVAGLVIAGVRKPAQEQTSIVAIIMRCLLSLIEQRGAWIVPLMCVIMASCAYGAALHRHRYCRNDDGRRFASLSC